MAEKCVPVSCNYDCISGCPLEAVVSDGKVVKVRNNPKRKRYMNGCVRGFLSPSVLYNPRRLLTPLVRRGKRGEGEFRPVEWEEAIDIAAEGLTKLKSSYGAASVMRMGGSGACRGVVHNTAALTRRFLSLFGGFTDLSGSFSSAATDFTKPYLFGTQNVGIDVKTLFSSELVILWGFNAADTRFGTETGKVLDEVRSRGIPIIVVDPRKTRSVKRFSAQWIPVYPGGDAAMMAAMLYVILTEGKADRECIDRLSTGFEYVEKYIKGESDGVAKDPQWAEELTGIPAAELRRFALKCAEASPAAILPGLSIQRTLGGEEADRLGAALQLAAGNIGIPGGSVGSGQWNVLPHPKVGTVPVPENPAGLSVPVYRWADAVLDPAGEGIHDIKGLYSVGGNYASQGSDIKKNRRALAQSEFTLCHDAFLTETCRWADVVFPAALFLERRDVLKSHTNYLFYSERAVPPLGGAKTDYRIFTELAERLGFKEAFTEGMDEDQWLDRCIEESDIEDREDFFSSGIYAGSEQLRVGLSDFVRDPEKHPLNTPSGKIEITSMEYEKAGGNRIPLVPVNRPRRKYPLRMVTPHAPARVNSQFHDTEELERLNDDRVWIHPDDAADRGIEENSRIVVESEVGRMYGNAKVSGDILAGVVSCNQGVWPLLTTEEEDLAGAVNILTSTEPTMPSRGARTHSVLVEIWKAEKR
ncbi:MAG: molybdopterin-dependent oxidoreductase [Spirochaetaceae bacterium]